MATLTILPTKEVSDVKSGKRYFYLTYQNIDLVTQLSLVSFIRDNLFAKFDYWTKNKYPVVDEIGNDYYLSLETDCVIANKDKKSNLWVEDDITVYTYTSDDTVISIADTISAPFTIFIGQEYKAGTRTYLTIQGQNNTEVKVRQVDSSYLVLSVSTTTKVIAQEIPLNYWEFDLAGTYFKMINYSISIDNGIITLAHNGQIVQVNLAECLNADSGDFSSCEITNGTNVYDFVLVNKAIQGDVLGGFKYWLGKNLTISVYTNSVTLSEKAPTYIQGRPNYTCAFGSRKYCATQNKDGTFNMQITLKEV